MASTSLIVDYIIGKSKQQLTPMQVNKLSYLSYGFVLAIKNEKLFNDKVEAWRYGPVIPSIYHNLKHYGGGIILQLQYCGTYITDNSKIKTRLKFIKNKMPLEHVEIINKVLENYGDFSGAGLSTIAHEKGTPWYQCYKKGKLGVEIPDTLTREYYRKQLQ